MAGLQPCLHCRTCQGKADLVEDIEVAWAEKGIPVVLVADIDSERKEDRQTLVFVDWENQDR